MASQRRKSMVERCYEQVNELRGHRILGSAAPFFFCPESGQKLSRKRLRAFEGWDSDCGS